MLARDANLKSVPSASVGGVKRLNENSVAR